jgi:phosphohistidine phosphatase
MKRVWLLRHAKSSWDDPALADHDRPLAPRGIKASGRIGRWARGNHVAPGLVLCSSALRAQQTLELVAHAVELPDPVVERRLYLASAEELLRRLGKIDDAVGEALVVAHNPGLHDLVALLAPPGPDELPTGALAGVSLDIDRWRDVAPGSGRLDAFVRPRSLTG